MLLKFKDTEGNVFYLGGITVSDDKGSVIGFSYDMPTIGRPFRIYEWLDSWYYTQNIVAVEGV